MKTYSRENDLGINTRSIFSQILDKLVAENVLANGDEEGTAEAVVSLASHHLSYDEFSHLNEDDNRSANRNVRDVQDCLNCNKWLSHCQRHRMQV